MKTKIFAILFTFSVGVGTLYSQTVISVGANLSWNLSNGTLTISGNGAMNDFYYSTNQPYTTKESPWYSARASIKRVVINSGVTSIGDAAFYGCSGLTSITIPNSVTSIGDNAFNGCTRLTSITIPNSVTSIGYGAFKDCTRLTSVTIPNSVTGIGDYTFQSCTGLTSVTIPNSVTNIGIYAFSGCSGLTGELVIPNSVTSIGSYAFEGCSSLTSVTIPNSVSGIEFQAFAYCSGLTSVTIPNGVTSIGRAAFHSCSSLPSITIPNSVTSIGQFAFAYCSSLTSVTIPNSVTSIGDQTFESCTGLTSVTIPNSVTSIGQFAFAYCSSLTSVTIPNSVTSIERYAFSECDRLTSVTIGNSVTSIGEWAFSDCSGLTSVTIGNSVTSIGEYAFYNCTGLTSVTIPNSVTSIGNYAFNGCSVNTINFTGTLEDWLNKVWSPVSVSNNYKLKINGVLQENIIISNSVINIGDNAFNGCNSLASIEIPNSVTNIGDGAFGSCSGLFSVTINSDSIVGKSYLRNIFGTQVKEYILGDGVTCIGQDAFRDCTGLTSVTIGNSVTSIGTRAFYNCTGLTSVTIPNSVTSIGGSAFAGCSSLTSVVWNAKNCSNSGNFGSQVTTFTFGDEVEVIPASICAGMTNLTSITIPSSVTSIGDNAFDGCSGLTSVTIGNSVTSIGTRAFYNCTGLTSVTIPNSVTSIGGSVFTNCTSLTSVTVNSNSVIRNNLKNIFGSQVTQYIIGSDITSIPNTIFRDYSNLTSIVVEPGNSTYDSRNDCNAIIETATNSLISGCKNTVIPNSATSIGNYAFYGCSGLTSVTIPNSVTSIGDRAFRNCISLTNVSIPNSVTSIGDGAFYGCTGLTSVTIGNNVTSIGSSAFDNCNSLTSVTIGNSVNNIGNYAFNNCTSLTSVTIPNSVTHIGRYAFGGCKGLTSVTSLATTPPPCLYYSYEMAFAGVDCSNIPLYVPMESVSLYQAANMWKEFNVIGVMFADEVETAVFSATPTDDSGVILEWQAVENAVLYNIDIIQGNDTIRKLQFDSNGKLLNSPSNAPYRYPNIHHASAAILSGNGWRYEVNDLDPGTNYTYSITVKAENGSVLYMQSISFTTKEKTFIIKFVNWNGEELLVLPEVVKGTTPSYTGETPVRPNTAEYTYTFVGWTPAIVAATSDTTYTATYTATKNSYTITWQNEDGSLIDQTTVEYGVVPTHAEPTKEATEEYTYTFTGWTPAVVAVTGDATYKATFTATKNSYTITWQNEDGSLIDQTTVEYGVVPTHADPTKEATEEYTYTFTGWTPAVVAVTGDATYKATFSSVVNVYTISVSAVNGQVIGGGEYQYGATIDLTAIPNEGYVFDQWSDGVKDNPRTITVTGDAEYTALFTSTEGFENIYTSEPVQKVIIDQNVYILRGDKVYNAQGALVK